MGRSEICREYHIDQRQIVPNYRGDGSLCIIPKSWYFVLGLSYTVNMFSVRTEAVGFSEILVAIC
jgi:hypothetical protein